MKNRTLGLVTFALLIIGFGGGLDSWLYLRIRFLSGYKVEKMNILKVDVSSSRRGSMMNWKIYGDVNGTKVTMSFRSEKNQGIEFTTKSIDVYWNGNQAGSLM